MCVCVCVCVCVCARVCVCVCVVIHSYTHTQLAITHNYVAKIEKQGSNMYSLLISSLAITEAISKAK